MKTILLLIVLAVAAYIGFNCLKSFKHSSVNQRAALAEVCDAS